MKLPRLLSGLALAAALSIPAAAAIADPAYPNRPLRLIVPYTAGSATDMLARIMTEPLSRALGQPVIVDNKPGNNSVLGTQLLARSAPDGYTLELATNAGLAASPGGLTGNVPYDPVKDLSYITLVGSVYYVWLVNNDVPAKTAPELIDLIKANPGKYNYASGNTGGITFGGYMKNTYKLDMAHVPYKSTPPALVDLVGGQVQVMMGDVASAQTMLKTGKIRAVAVPSAKRNPLLPDVPTFAEQGLATPPDMAGWWAVVAPAGVPASILDRLSAELTKILNDPAIQESMLSKGIVPSPSTRDEVTRYQQDQLATWTKMIRDLGLQQQ